MTDINQIVRQPIFFERNRVYRIYLGGAQYTKVFDTADGYDDGTDNFFPEEWIASKVKAINPRYFGERDGVSVVKGTHVFLDDLLRDKKEEMLGDRKYDCLVKFLDSAIRLPFQVHPTKAFSRENFNSDYGKTEAWLVVETRKDAKLYFGFKNKISKEELSALETRSEVEKNIMGDLLYSVPAHAGDVWLIKAGLIHALGAGCTVVEVQEPTDFTIQPEKWCGDYHISEAEEYIGLTKDRALDAINYDIYGDAAVAYAKVNPKIEINTPNYTKEVLISYDDTPCFAENRHILRKNGHLIMNYAPSVWICTAGEAVIRGKNYEKTVKCGDYFYLPYIAEGQYTIESSKEATLIECLPSKQNYKNTDKS